MNKSKHINSLLVVFFYQFFPELFDRIYICKTPLYRITLNANTYKYFMNDREYNDYKIEFLKDKFKITNKEFTLDDIVNASDKFLMQFNFIKYKYSLENELLNIFLRYNDIEESLIEIGETYEDLDVYLDTQEIQGLFENGWINFQCNKDFINDLNELKNIANGMEIVDFKEGNSDELLSADLFDIIDLFNKKFKFVRYRFKGLGEISPDELWATTLNPEHRCLVKVELDECEEIVKQLFGNNADLRKDFIQERLSDIIK